MQLIILKSPCSILSPSEEDIFLFQIWSQAFLKVHNMGYICKICRNVIQLFATHYFTNSKMSMHILSPTEEDIFLFQIWCHAFKRLTLWFTFKFSLSAAPPQTNATWVFGIHIGRFILFFVSKFIIQ